MKPSPPTNLGPRAKELHSEAFEVGEEQTVWANLMKASQKFNAAGRESNQKIAQRKFSQGSEAAAMAYKNAKDPVVKEAIKTDIIDEIQKWAAEAQ